MSEITVTKELKIGTKKLDTIIAGLCFIFDEKSAERDDMIKREIAKYALPFARAAFEDADFYTRVGGKAGQDAILKRFCRALYKRYVERGLLITDKWVDL